MACLICSRRGCGGSRPSIHTSPRTIDDQHVARLSQEWRAAKVSAATLGSRGCGGTRPCIHTSPRHNEDERRASTFSQYKSRREGSATPPNFRGCGGTRPYFHTSPRPNQDEQSATTKLTNTSAVGKCLQQHYASGAVEEHGPLSTRHPDLIKDSQA